MEKIKRSFIELPGVEPQTEPTGPTTPETTTEDTKTPERTLRSRWTSLVQGMRETYKGWKKNLTERTDATLTEVADHYVGDWQREQPATMYQAAQRAVEAARQSLTVKKTIDLAVRSSLTFVEFNAQMAAKQFLVDIAIRQADCDTLTEKYGGADKVKAIESEAMQFANQVREQFAELQHAADRMRPEGEHDQEAFRQKHIEHGMAYARQLLEGVTIIPEQRGSYAI